MRRMYSEEQLIKLIEEHGGQVSPEDIQAMFDDGEISLDGKYVKIMNAPTSTTLTEEQILSISEGVFVQGNFLDLVNPVFFPYGTSSTGTRRGALIGADTSGRILVATYSISNENVISKNSSVLIEANGRVSVVSGKPIPNFPASSIVQAQYISRRGTIEWYVPVAQDNITSGDTIAIDSALGKALIDHLDVEINGFRARYEYVSGNYVVYSSKTEIDSGAKMQVNMISYNTTNGTLSFNQMTFTPNN